MEEIPSLNMPVQRLKVAILLLDLLCSGPVTQSGEILTNGKSYRKKPDRFSLNNDMLTLIYTNLKYLICIFVSIVCKKYYIIYIAHI
jgi:hypothetical protein